MNECAFNNGGCRETCTNTAGSYTCGCQSGFHLQEDGFACGSNRPGEWGKGGGRELGREGRREGGRYMERRVGIREPKVELLCMHFSTCAMLC